MRPSGNPCRAKAPNGEPCSKPRGHRYSDLGGAKLKHRTEAGHHFTGGVRTPATWWLPSDNRMSDADFQTWGKRL